MRKIKFKTEYVPLSDDVINRHKDFDQLMAMYVAAPKMSWFKKIIQKKWTMFGGGLMTGAIVASLLWYNYEVANIAEPVSEYTPVTTEVQPAPENQVKPSTEPAIDNIDSKADSEIQSQEVTSSRDEVLASTSEEGERKAEEGNANSSRLQTEKKPVQTKEKEPINSEKNSAAVAVVAEKQNSVIENQKENTQAEENNSASEYSSLDDNAAGKTTPINEVEGNDNRVQTGAALIAEKLVEPETSDETAVVTHQEVAIGPPFPTPFIGEEDLQELNSEVTDKLVPQNDTPVFQEEQAMKSPVTEEQSTKEKSRDEKKEKSNSSGPAAAGFLGLGIHLFDRDSTKQEVAKEDKKGLFAFLKDSTKEDKNSELYLADTAVYPERYAQVSFITPLSSNGIDGYKYMHYVSLNVLQGYNGALKGVEFGGLLNGEKGYVTGAQFGGLANYSGGRLKGVQFGGLTNIAQSVTGAQFAGITNVSASFVSGFQAAAIVNIAPDSLNGAQVAGIINMLGSEKKASMAQIAGIGNVSLANSKGAQIAGIFNLANKHNGGQIGLINVGKNIKGFQIGLINISDTISGVPIGLISLSSNGIFDVDGWTSDLFTFNAAIRVGSPYVYNIYAYGVSPFESDLPFGFGVGIGGHIPIKDRVFMDIDGMAWTTHRSYFSFNGVNMVNQLRVMGGFRIHKYVSVFGGPTFNVGVQDNRYDPFNSGSFYEHTGENTTVYMWPGFVAGIRLF